jgi:hypothetical protein
MSTLLAGVKRKLPGYAILRPNSNEPWFHKGVVEHTSWGQTGSLSQKVAIESKLLGTNGYITLIGETYAYFCESCKVTVWEQEMNALTPMRSGSVTAQRCPFCEGPISPLQPGDKVRVHYRFGTDKETGALRWGSFWAEKVGY